MIEFEFNLTYSDLYYASFNRNFVEFLQLIEATVPIIEYLEKVHQVHCHLLNRFLVKLALVYLQVLLVLALVDFLL